MFFANPYFYSAATIVLQAICIIHCLRKRKQGYWIWAIIFLPIIGSLAYIFTEMFSGNELKNVQSGIGTVFNPGGRIKTLQENLRFSDTFNNKAALADAYLAAGQTAKAVELYENSLTGAFVENEYVLTRLVIAYFEMKRYDDVIATAKKIYRLPQFARSRAHLLYAMALEYTGNNDMAEKEFRMMKSRFANFEARYQYGLFLQRLNRDEEARKIFTEMLEEVSQLNSRERREGTVWFSKAKEELKKIAA